MTKPSYCWIHVTAGQGPEECMLAVGEISCRIMQDAKDHGLKSERIESSMPGSHEKTWGSILMSFEGDELETFFERWKGTVQWICKSPFRPCHSRKNWFIGVDVLVPPQADFSFDQRDVVFQTLRATGPGSQHVNTTDSAC